MSRSKEVLEKLNNITEAKKLVTIPEAFKILKKNFKWVHTNYVSRRIRMNKKNNTIDDYGFSDHHIPSDNSKEYDDYYTNQARDFKHLYSRVAESHPTDPKKHTSKLHVNDIFTVKCSNIRSKSLDEDEFDIFTFSQKQNTYIDDYLTKPMFERMVKEVAARQVREYERKYR